MFLFGTMSLLKVGVQNKAFSVIFFALFGSFPHQGNYQIEQPWVMQINGLTSCFTC